VTRVHHLSAGGLEVSTIVSDAPWTQNCHVVVERASGSFIVVDPGFDSPELRDSIRGAGPQPAHILITHGHPDHLGAAADLSEWLEVPCRLDRADSRIARHASAYAAAFGGLRIRTPRRIEYLDDDASLDFGQTPVQSLALPGHTPGSRGFALGEVVLTGDTLFREHVGRTDFPDSDPAALSASIDRLLADRAPGVHLLAGHGRPWTAGEASHWWAATERDRAAAAS
jgi:glyoxylase-like metal-dependent hydrolase (beta-lactamase superfamily II)